ncbi:VOC family protein [Pseudalkalibacillus hwajinpoensis]|uniref:VOC family protein n=1 Tax=Guptibacillus hwajinpoensis TaxID=208199 RepID=A0A4U1MKD0_9BACL|nr:VOC family protein [Pseudalkalibacillus hwajinpoensis]TKD71603.1 VOC family protein [Pseudalkalibacillus hwajinpoensis]
MNFKDFTAIQIRIARPTDQLEEIVRFYEYGLGLKRVAEFSGHVGYTGVVYGLPNLQYQLEFTTHEQGSPCPAPTTDNLLVFYISNKEELEKVVARLQQMGHGEVEPENVYWKERGVTIEDPDGWRVVLMNTEGI